MSRQSFENLQVGKRGCQLAVETYRTLQDARNFGLRDQMQRAAVSIPSNIAEGSERPSKDSARFLSISLGSAAELRTQAYIAAKVDLIDSEAMTRIVDETRQLAKMLQTIIKRIDP